MTESVANFDPPPPAETPLLKWGDPLPMNWGVSNVDTVYITPQPHFLTQHGASFVEWGLDGTMTEAFGAYHVQFPDGTRGQARHQTSGMGMVVMDRPWRRRRENSWWPGNLHIFQDRLVWSDHDSLLELWRPHDRELPRLMLAEFGPGHMELKPDQFHWPEFYLAMCDHAGLLDAVRDNDFASSAYTFLCQHQIVRHSDGKRMLSGSDRRYGDMLGAWRRCGESYLDFLFDLPGTVSLEHMPQLSRMIDEAGFRAKPC